MGKKKGKRGGVTRLRPTSDLYEAEERTAPEERSTAGRRFDDVDVYEYELPSDMEEEEIDEENAFTAEDRKLYGDDPFGVDAMKGGKMGRRRSQEGDDGDEEDDYDDAEEEEEEEEEIEKEMAKRRREFEMNEGGGNEDEEEEDDEDEDGDEEEEDLDDEGYRSMVKAATGRLPREERVRLAQPINELAPESEFNIQPDAATTGRDATVELTLADMTRAAASTGDAEASRLLKKVDKFYKKNRVADVPLPTAVRERIERQAGYEKTKEDVSHWQTMVKANREARTIRFPAPSEDGPRVATSTAALAAAQRLPQNELEAEVEALLREAGASSERTLAETELKTMSTTGRDESDARERQAKLLRMRNLMFRHEVKAKRLKKIKSKEYRRKLKKAEKRKAAAEGGEVDLDMLRQENPEAVEEMALIAERERAVERISLKHSNSGKWAKRLLKRGAKGHMNAGIQAQIAEQIRLGQQRRTGAQSLGARPSGADDDTDEDGSEFSSEGESGSDEEEEENGGKKKENNRQVLLDLLNGNEEEEIPKSGLLGLPFMQRAIEKKRQEVARDADAMLAELASSDDDEEVGEEGRRGAAVSNKGKEEGFVGPVTGRMSFGQASGGGGKDTSDNEGSSEEEEGPDSGGEDDDAEITAKLRKSKRAAIISDAGDDKGEGGLDGGMRDRGKNSSSSSKRSTHSAHLFGDRHDVEAVAKSLRIEVPSCNVVVQPKSQAAAKKSAHHAVNGDSSRKNKDVVNEEEEEEEPYSSAQESEEDERDIDLMKAVKKKGVGTMSQRELIHEAFAGDDVEEDFREAKRADVEEELPEEEDLNPMPGWGMWSNQQKKPKWMVEKEKLSKQKRAAAAKSRKDANLQHVVVTEKYNRKAAKYTTETIPHQFRNKKVYEASIQTPLGPELNTAASFRSLNRPKVLKTAGAPIGAPKMSRKFGKAGVIDVEDAPPDIINPMQALGSRPTKKRKP